LDASSGCPSRKPSRAIKTLLDQIQLTVGEQSDDLPHSESIVESDSETDGNMQASSSDSEGLVTVAPIRQPAAKKKLKAKVVDAGDISGDEDGMVPMLIYFSCYDF
jgi:hypothetical protein